MASILKGYSYDIFISYRQKDNKYDGWVTEFVDNLKRELESMFKEEISVYFDINPSDYLLESYDVDASLKDKLKCLVFIPIISRTYCDPKSFAWDNELNAFFNEASGDQFGFKVKLPNGNVANRVLPIRIHDLDPADIKLFESVVGGVMRSIDFVYKETGVNRQLRAKDDDIIIKTSGQNLYRDQINKAALAIKEIIESMKSHAAPIKRREIQESEDKKVIEVEETAREKIILPEQEIQGKRIIIKEKDRKFSILWEPRFITPIIMGTLAVLIITVIFLYRGSKIKWSYREALPKIEQLRNEFKFTEAFYLVQKAEKYIPKESKFKELASFVTARLTIQTDPPGADVYIREYPDVNGEWKNLGKTPIENLKIPNRTFYLVRIEKAGHENLLMVVLTGSDTTISRKLLLEDQVPDGMVYVADYRDKVRNKIIKDSCGFFMDRYEVTNKQFKEFVDNGGYRKSDYWTNEFIKNGRRLSWDEAIILFTDKTGRPGPATWEAGDYPDGKDNYPVNGISWYEAAAYAEYAGKELPTSDHWESGAGIYLPNRRDYFGSKLYPLSNFSGKGPEPVGKNQGINYYGAYDMAGNVREWCWNETGVGRIIAGGGWSDATYLYGTSNQLPPFDRSPENGFRCVKFIKKELIPESAYRSIKLGSTRDYSKENPASNEIFRIYKNQFQYDKTDLKIVLEEKDESNEDWIIEKISFDAAYDEDRMISYLYLPKNASPPFQTLVFFPGSYAVREKDLKNQPNTIWFLDYILKSGRAVMYPVYFRTYERNDGQTLHLPTKSHQYTDLLIKLVKDFRRSIDYLETRTDIDTKKLGFYGHSWGGTLCGVIPAVEDRLTVNISIVGGFYGNGALPEADAVNYLPRVTIPTLMLNGQYDYRYPVETNLNPFFNLLGTPENQKRLIIYETDHYVAKTDMVKEVLGWCDKYMGPAK
jgi:eukaryotic-like serine/threonine-protein kinase